VAALSLKKNFIYLFIFSVLLFVYLQSDKKFNKKIFYTPINKNHNKESLNLNLYEDYIIIGINITLSGIKSENDEGVIIGATLAEEKINSEGGVLGKKIKVLFYDNKGTPVGAKIAAEKAIKEGAVAVIGANRSSQTIAIAPVMQKARIPLVTPISTVDNITHIGDFIFRMCYTDSYQGKKLAEYAIENLDISKTVILKLLDEEYSLVLADNFYSFFNSKGKNIAGEFGYKTSDMDYTEILNIAKKINPTLIFIPVYSKDGGLLIRQAKKMGINSLFLGGDGLGARVYDFAGDTADGLLVSDHWHASMKYRLTNELIEKHKEKYNTEIIKSTGTPLSFDSVLLIADAIKRAGSTNGEILRKAISETENFEGSSGVYSFDINGDAVNKPLAIMELKNGDKVLKALY